MAALDRVGLHPKRVPSYKQLEELRREAMRAASQIQWAIKKPTERQERIDKALEAMKKIGLTPISNEWWGHSLYPLEVIRRLLRIAAWVGLYLRSPAPAPRKRAPKPVATEPAAPQPTGEVLADLRKQPEII